MEQGERSRVEGGRTVDEYYTKAGSLDKVFYYVGQCCVLPGLSYGLESRSSGGVMIDTVEANRGKGRM